MYNINYNYLMYIFLIMKRKFKQWWLKIPPTFCKSTKQPPLTSNHRTQKEDDMWRWRYRSWLDSTHHFFRNACTKSGSLRFSQFSGCWLILSVYILMSFDFPFVRLFEFGNFVITLIGTCTKMWRVKSS
jgi:hypothetical protein